MAFSFSLRETLLYMHCNTLLSFYACHWLEPIYNCDSVGLRSVCDVCCRDIKAGNILLGDDGAVYVAGKGEFTLL